MGNESSAMNAPAPEFQSDAQPSRRHRQRSISNQTTRSSRSVAPRELSSSVGSESRFLYFSDTGDAREDREDDEEPGSDIVEISPLLDAKPMPDKQSLTRARSLSDSLQLKNLALSSTRSPSASSSDSPTTSLERARTIVDYVYPVTDARHRSSFRGEMVGNVRQGQGKLVWQSGAEYCGEWKDDKMDGHGVLRLPSGFKYSGEWKNGAFNGSGTVVWSNGRRYDGQWENNRQHGVGILSYGSLDPRSRDLYAGEWVHGARTGAGMMRWKGGSCYFGCWDNGKRHGFGEHRYSSGEVFRGFWHRGRRHGPGLRVDAIGCNLIGCWHNDRKHGTFFVVFPHGRIHRVLFHNGRSATDQHGGEEPVIQSLQVLCIEAVASAPALRDAVLRSAKTERGLVSAQLSDNVRWAFQHIVLGREKSVRLWDRVAETFHSLTNDLLVGDDPR